MDENELLEENLGLVVKQAKKYYGTFKKLNNNVLDYEDLIQVGSVGLIKAIRTFDSEVGFTFGTYASKCILNEMYTEYKGNTRQRNYDETKKFTSLQYLMSADGEAETLEKIVGEEDYEFENLESKEMLTQIIDVARDILKENEFSAWFRYINGDTAEIIGKQMGVKRTTMTMRLKRYRRLVLEAVSYRLKISEKDIV